MLVEGGCIAHHLSVDLAAHGLRLRLLAVEPRAQIVQDIILVCVWMCGLLKTVMPTRYVPCADTLWSGQLLRAKSFYLS